MMDYTLGIDLGTTFSVIAVVDESGSPVVIQNSEGSNTTPSVVYFGERTPIVGEEAKEYQAYGENEVAAFFKRSMGDSQYILDYHGKTYDTIDLSALVLKKLKRDAEKFLGRGIADAVITVPAYFNNGQREATIEAGKRAGLNVIRIINEPTAAAIAYGMDRNAGGKVLVYDLGGGTFDVTIASIGEFAIDVLATDGDHSLGGKDWDDCLAMYVSDMFEEEFGINPLDDDDAFNSVLVSCEKAKKQLSAREGTTIKVVYGGNSAQYTITKELFEDVTQHLVERTLSLTIQAMENARLNWHELADVILVGGSTRMPMISDVIEKRFGKKPKSRINVDEVVACGAAIQGAADAAKAKSVPSFTIGGAKSIRDVMSHSMGMVAVNDDQTQYINSIIISKNKPIPATENRPFQIQTSSSRDNFLEVFVTQGESERPLDCDILGKYVISNIAHVEQRKAIVNVAYTYDENGIVMVKANEEASGRPLHVSREAVPKDLSWLDERPPQEGEVIIEPLSVYIAIDLSYSMEGNPLREAQKAAKEFVRKMDLDHTKVGIIGFADKSQITLPKVNDPRSIMSGIEQLKNLFDQASLGYGNKGEPFTDSFNDLKNADGRRFLIVLTDGLWANQGEAVRLAKKCHAEDIEVISVGFGSADKDFLKAVATADENALATDLTQIVDSFSKIAQVLSESSRVTGKHGKRSLKLFS
jgi:molecular chaperone DnaK